MSSLVFSIRVKKNGVLANADSTPVLSDQAAVYGVRRADNLAVIVAANTAMTHDGTGLYSYTLASPVAGVTYDAVVKLVINGATYYVPRSKTAIAATSGTTYQTADEADDLAAARPGLAAFKAASAEDKLAARLFACERIDAAYRWQGQKYGPAVGVAQVREFPRIARGDAYQLAGATAFGADPMIAWQQLGLSATEVWDLDSDGVTVIVPLNVRLAELYEADAILSGLADQIDARAQALGGGVASQSIGSAAESYFAANTRADGRPKLSVNADRYVMSYRLTSGQIR